MAGVKSACGTLQGNLPMKTVFSIVKFRARATWASLVIPTIYFSNKIDII